jgi:hypothetical protein
MTIVKSMELGRELINLVSQINQQIDEVKREAKRLNVPAYSMRDVSGGYTLVPLLAAKAQVLHSLVLINQK